MGAVWKGEGFEVTCLTDGAKVFAPEVFAGLRQDQREARLAAAGEDEIRTEFNAFLIRDPAGGLSLVDTGCGPHFGPGAGHLGRLLAEMGLSREEIGRVIFTHLHGDHCGGTLDGDALVYGRAEVVMHPAEAAYWQGKEGLAGRVLSACEGKLRLVEGEVAPGIVLWPLPGHTPGHCGLRIGAGLVIVGDIVHSEALQLPDPETATIYDVDAALARASRRAALDEVAQRGLVWSGGHVLGPRKFARLERAGDGFAKVAL